MRKLDAYLNDITMYRLLVYVLGTFAAAGVGAALLGQLSSSATEMIVSLGLLLSSAYAVNRGLARWLGVPSNNESWLITSLILFLILRPADSVATGLVLVSAGAVSSASKYLLARRGKHIFNPAALAAALVTISGLSVTTWWIGSSLFWPLALVLGLIVVRKIRRFPLVLAYVVTAVMLQALRIILDAQPLGSNLQHALLSSPLIFLATIMLTEPATMPPRRKQQLVFGVMVAVLYVTAWQIGPLVIYPEVALLVGNLYAYAVAPKVRLRLRLKEIQRISERVAHYVFVPDRPLKFWPGQYMEWTLPDVPYDSRGNRRTFTLASSPTESTLQIGVKFNEPASMYKATLAGLIPGDVMYAGQLAGDFTLKGHERDPLLFVAGGIGITPFRSMVTYFLDTGMRADVVLVYGVSDPSELAYMETFARAASVGVRTVPVVTRPGFEAPGMVAGPITRELLARLVPDLAHRTAYVSGPNAMVEAVSHSLRTAGVAATRIKTDHFSGY